MKFIQQINRYFRQSFALCLLCLAPCILSAATINDLNFTPINNDTEYSVSAKDPASIAGALTIPATHNGKPVTAVFFENCSALTSVDLSQTALTSIKDYAFSGCSSLASVTFPQTLISIKDYSFSQCSALTSIDLSQTALKSIGLSAFNVCTALASVTLPQSLNSLGNHAFDRCISLTSIDLSQTALNSIGDYAFFRCFALASVTLPQTLNSLANYAFHGCTSLTSVTLPNTLTSIGDQAFSSCHKLASVTFLGSAPTLGADVFLNAGQDVSGGLKLTIYKDYEASYASWGTGYTFNVVPGPPFDLAKLLLTSSYNPTSKALSILTKNEPSSATLTLQHTDSLGGAWADLSFLEYIQVSDSTSGTVTRTLTLDPATKKTGFYRIISAPANP